MMNPQQIEQIIDQARRLLYEEAMIKLDGEFVGTVAAIPQDDCHDLNYTEVFIRDNIPVMVFFLLDGKTEIVRNFLETCLLSIWLDQ